ncbi:MAG: transmembrane protein [uncultured bacterium]|nr:MAG: transmembrane protein [uncultured bacterium]OGT15363.1 MAG: hypothetical protein A3B69_05025 [Gammaproteobacteria bacterium RIFCSPHIGHO2_02_FULL_38_33]OGT24029.1 MAG: hypothetical protein A2W47_05255 [Gammaproteobacteria bacterium RIFCSPHIGHO2_12_38_15]OGT69250.1 MAG: hypothetical protein A3I12_04415 [Gammaproteobacteria bacterium RIFCSPLOWO2_02_FULL_38_11]OGT75219.1 MAG: hypothetical protein A3G71_01470 [Gammaproteobacteria bacterium RIFCSPLOWO2_12_FULL_38_14]
MRLFRRYLIAGLFVWLPLWVTLLVIRFVIDVLDSTLSLLPRAYRPDELFGMHIPGLGVILSLVVLLLTGVLVTNFIGNWLIQAWESFLARIPLVRTIYAGVKKILETLFSPSGQSFRKVLLVEYPRLGMWSIAFQTGNGAPVLNQAAGKEFITIFIPTTPNPTSGFLMLVPKDQVIELKMSVDAALKFVISLGVLQPFSKVKRSEDA